MSKTNLSLYYWNTADSKWYEARTHTGKNALKTCSIQKDLANPAKATITLLNPSKDPTSTDTAQSQGFLTNVFPEYTHIFIKDNSTKLILFRGRVYNVKEIYDMSRGPILELKAYDALKELLDQPIVKELMYGVDVDDNLSRVSIAYSPAVTVANAGNAVIPISGGSYVIFRVNDVAAIENGDIIKIDNEELKVIATGAFMNYSSGSAQDDNDVVAHRAQNGTAQAEHAHGAAVTKLIHLQTHAIDRRRSGLIKYIINRSRAKIRTDVGIGEKLGISKIESSEHQFTQSDLDSFTVTTTADDRSSRIYDVPLTSKNLLQEIHSIAEADPWDSREIGSYTGYDYYVDPNIPRVIAHGDDYPDPTSTTWYPSFNYFKRGSRPGIGYDGVTTGRNDTSSHRNMPKSLPIAYLGAAITTTTAKGIAENISVTSTATIKALFKHLETSVASGVSRYDYKFSSYGTSYTVDKGLVIQIDTEEMLVTNVGTDTLTVFRGVNSTTVATHVDEEGVRAVSRGQSSPEAFGLTFWYPTSKGTSSFSAISRKYRGTFSRSIRGSSTFTYEEKSFFTSLLVAFTKKAWSKDGKGKKTTEHVGQFERLTCKLNSLSVADGGTYITRTSFADDIDSNTETQPLGRRIWDTSKIVDGEYVTGDWAKDSPAMDIEKVGALAKVNRIAQFISNYLPITPLLGPLGFTIPRSNIQSGEAPMEQTQFLYAGKKDANGIETISEDPCAVIVYATTNTDPGEDLYKDHVILRYIHNADDSSIEHNTAAVQTALRIAHRSYFYPNGDSFLFDTFPTAADLPTGKSYITLYGQEMPWKTGLAATTTLAATMSASATTFTVPSGQGSKFVINEIIKINSEVMKISGISGDVITVASGYREYDGTTAAEHASGQSIYKGVRPSLKFDTSSGRPADKLEITKVAKAAVPSNLNTPSLILKFIANALTGNVADIPITSHIETSDYPYVKLIIQPENIDAPQGYHNNVLTKPNNVPNNTLVFKSKTGSASNKAFLNNLTANATTNDLFTYGAKPGAVIAELNSAGNITRYSYLDDYQYNPSDDTTYLFYGRNMLDTNDGGQLRTTAQVAGSQIPSQTGNTTFAVTSTRGSKYSADNIIKIDSEYMLVVSVSGDNLTVQRGYSLTSPEVQDTGSIATHDVGVNIHNWCKMAIIIPTETGHAVRVKHPKIGLDSDSIVQTIEIDYAVGNVTAYVDAIGLKESVGVPTQTSSIKDPSPDSNVIDLITTAASKAPDDNTGGNNVVTMAAGDQAPTKITIQNGELKPGSGDTMVLRSNYKTRLSAAITNAPAVGTLQDITINASAWTKSPAPGFRAHDVVMIDTEELLVTSTSSGGNTLTVQRGYNDTTPATHIDTSYISKSTVQLSTPRGIIDIKISDININGGLTIGGTDAGDEDSAGEKHMVFYRPVVNGSGYSMFGGSHQLQAYPMDRHDNAVADEDKMSLWSMGSTLGNKGGYKDSGVDIEFGVATKRTDAPYCHWHAFIPSAVYDETETVNAQLSTNGITATLMKKGNQGWSTDLVIEGTAWNVIKWHEAGEADDQAGTISFSDNTTESITADAAETLGAAGTWYLYKNVGDNASATLVLTQTYSDVYQDDRVLLAVIIREDDNDDSTSPTILPFNGSTPTLSTGALTAGAILADHLTANMVISNTIKTSSTTGAGSSGEGVLINNTGIKGYASNGGLEFEILATSGKAQFGGTATIGQDGFQFPSGTSGSVRQIQWGGVPISDGSGGEYSGGSISLYREDSTNNIVFSNMGAHSSNTAAVNKYIYFGGIAHETFVKFNSRVGINTNVDANYYLNIVGASSGTKYALATDGWVKHQNLASSTGTDLVVASSGVVYQSSSSKKYKENIVDLTVDTTKLYNLNPVSFKYKDIVTKDDEDNVIETVIGGNSIGYLAEDVHEILPEIVSYNSDNSPESINYKLLTVLLVEEVKKLKTEVDTLKNG